MDIILHYTYYSSIYTYYGALELYCIVLYCIVLYCIVLYCIVLYCIVLYCVLYCIVLYCIMGRWPKLRNKTLSCLVLCLQKFDVFFSFFFFFISIRYLSASMCKANTCMTEYMYDR